MVIILLKMIVLTNVRADNSSQVIQVTLCSRNSCRSRSWAIAEMEDIRLKGAKSAQ